MNRRRFFNHSAASAGLALPPQSAFLKVPSFKETKAAYQKRVDDGLHLGMQVTVIHDGSVVLDDVYAISRPGVHLVSSPSHVAR